MKSKPFKAEPSAVTANAAVIVKASIYVFFIFVCARARLGSERDRDRDRARAAATFVWSSIVSAVDKIMSPTGNSDNKKRTSYSLCASQTRR